MAAASSSYSSQSQPAFNPEDPKLYPWFAPLPSYESAFDPEDPELLAQFAPLDLDEPELYTPTSPKYCNLDPDPRSDIDESEPSTPPTSPKCYDLDPHSDLDESEPYTPPTSPRCCDLDPDPHSLIPSPSYSNLGFVCKPGDPCSARFRLCPDNPELRARFLGKMETKA